MSSGSSAPSSAAEGASSRRAFLLRKLHGLTGVVPVGGFLVLHLWTNAAALFGRRSFDEAVGRIQALPALWAFELFGVLLPLAFHAAYGVWLWRSSAPNVGAYPHARNWAYFAQRITGTVVLLFVGLHLYELWAQKWFGGMLPTQFYGELTAGLSATAAGVPWRAFAYAIGVLAAAFHLANGLVGFAQGWGLVLTRAGQRRLGFAALALGCGLSLLGVATVVHFAAGPFLPQSEGSSPTSSVPSVPGPEGARSTPTPIPRPPPGGAPSRTP